jgi:hypothetical protein
VTPLVTPANVPDLESANHKSSGDQLRDSSFGNRSAALPVAIVTGNLERRLQEGSKPYSIIDSFSD